MAMTHPIESAAAVVEEPLAGNLDDCDWHKFWGWACNPADPDKPLWLEVVIDDRPPVPLLANRLRGDLASAGFGRGWVGFHLYFPTPLDPRKPHTIGVRRANDGQHLPHSPWQLPAAPAGGPDVRREFEAIMSAEIEAARSSVELSAMTDFMVRQTDRLLQAACDSDSGRRTRALFKERWGETLDGSPLRMETPEPRPLALFIGFDLPAGEAAKAMVMGLQAQHMRVAAAAMRGLPTTGEAAEALTAAGVQVLGAPLLFSIEDLLGRHAGLFRVIMLHGVLAAAAYGITARLHNPGARIVAWLDDPTQDAKASLAAQLLSDVVVTGTVANAALFDQRIRGWPIQIVDPDAEPHERAQALANAIRPPPKAKPAGG
jgi:hypothetical protein